MENNNKLPKIQDLYADKELALKQNELNMLLNQPPKQDWLKEHPMVKNLKYIPIQRVEWLLTSIFTKWWVEILNVQLIANSIQVTIRLFYQDPLTNEILHQDGVGAQPLQTDKDAGATDFNRIKSNAVQIGVPAAESYAVKDAAEKIGKIFGKDLNRADQIAYNLITTDTLNAEQLELIARIEKILPEKISEDMRESAKDRVKSGSYDKTKLIKYLEGLENGK